MLIDLDTYLLKDMFGNIRMPTGSKLRKVPFVRFNSSEHVKLREEGKDPYGAIQLIGMPMDFVNSARTERIWKYGDSSRKIAVIDKHPIAITVQYQLSVYAEKEREITYARMAIAKELPETRSVRLDIDVYGDGQTEQHIAHFLRRPEVYLEDLTQPRKFIVHIPFEVEAKIFYRNPTEKATFWNYGQVIATVLDRYDEFSADAIGDADTITDPVT